jgi:mRNA interferase HigB
MRVIARSTLTKFLQTLRSRKDRLAVKADLDAWFHEVEQANWRTSQDVKRLYAHASIIDAERVVFNIKGNDYRLVVSIDYERRVVYVKWLGSHKDYDRIDVRKVEYGDQTYQKR